MCASTKIDMSIIMRTNRHFVAVGSSPCFAPSAGILSRFFYDAFFEISRRESASRVTVAIHARKHGLIDGPL